MIFYRKGVRSTSKKGEEVLYDIESKINFSGLPLLPSLSISLYLSYSVYIFHYFYAFLICRISEFKRY